MINKQVFISILFMKNNCVYPKSLIILTTTTHWTNHRSENKKQITKPFWKCHAILRPSNQNYLKVECFVAPNQSVGLPEKRILLHFTFSLHVNVERQALLLPLCCSHLFSLDLLFTRAAWVKRVTDRSMSLNPSQHSDHLLHLFNRRAVTTAWLESGCKSC